MRRAALGKSWADGQAIVRQGEVGNCMFVVQAGEVEILRETEDGDVRLAVLGAGDFFGEMSIFEHEVRSATVRARGEARVLTVDKRTLLKRIKEDPFLAVGILQTMSNRIREVNAELVRARAAAAASTTAENPERETR
ncbi:MAG: cyclic nucleotide-binding domain-containing protein [Gemmatimonadetes bacterium]|nr:cyclic nucleotide-binding domain-containing protein [Gemmatimonadota bacterium]